MKNAFKKASDQVETADTTAAPAPQIKGAPKMQAGDAIELDPLKGKVIAIRIEGREDVKTKYGDRPMSQAVVIVEGAKEPLEGVLFQSYFQHLPIGDWFIGRVVKAASGPWGLDALNLDSKVVAQLTAVVATVPALSDVRF